jgi:hypothetical protein
VFKKLNFKNCTKVRNFQKTAQKLKGSKITGDVLAMTSKGRKTWMAFCFMKDIVWIVSNERRDLGAGEEFRWRLPCLRNNNKNNS